MNFGKSCVFAYSLHIGLFCVNISLFYVNKPLSPPPLTNESPIFTTPYPRESVRVIVCVYVTRCVCMCICVRACVCACICVRVFVLFCSFVCTLCSCVRVWMCGCMHGVTLLSRCQALSQITHKCTCSRLAISWPVSARSVMKTQ